MVELSLLLSVLVLADNAPPAPPPTSRAEPSAEAAEAEPPNGVPTRVEVPVVDTSKVEEPAAEASKVEEPAPEASKVSASLVETPKAKASKPEARLVEVVVPVRMIARNQMGRRFRLVEARFVLGGNEVARLSAAPGQEVDLSSPFMVVPLRRGEHALTATLVFQGRNVGPFSYLGNYRYRVESTYSFYLERTDRQPIIEVVAREQGGLMTPLERRPTLEISATNAAGVTPMIGVTHGTEVTVVR